MGFKATASFLRFLSMGAIGVHRTMDRLRERHFEPIELERHSGSNKIWTTKVKRLRLPDLLCVKTGMRAEVRAKTDLKIRMSDAPANPDRAWDAGLRDDDVVALIACFDTNESPQPAHDAVYFTVGALRASEARSKLGPPKSASEGAERDRTWAATVPTRDGIVLEVTDERLVVRMNADAERPARRQTYGLRGKSVYVTPGDIFTARSTILAGEPPTLADLSTYLPRRYAPLEELFSAADVDRYAAVKALRVRDDPPKRVVPALEHLIDRETEQRVALEAAGSAAALGSEVGQNLIVRFIWDNHDWPELRMEAAFIMSELGNTPFTRAVLNRILEDDRFDRDELRQAAVWALGKSRLRCYQDVIRFIADPDENVALHAIGALGVDVPRPVIDRLVLDLIDGNPRRAPAASEALRIVASDDVFQALVEATRAAPPVPDWIVATLGSLPPDQVRIALQHSPLLDRIAPMLLTAQGAHWLASEARSSDISFILKQNLY